MTVNADTPRKKPAARKRPAAARSTATVPTAPAEKAPPKASPKRPVKESPVKGPIATEPAAPAKASLKAAAKAAPKPTPAKPKKPKLVRDGFTMPKDEYARIDELKLRSAKLGRPAKKSELIRAGLASLYTANDAALLAALKAVPTLKTGRPKSDATA